MSLETVLSLGALLSTKGLSFESDKCRGDTREEVFVLPIEQLHLIGFMNDDPRSQCGRVRESVPALNERPPVYGLPDEAIEPKPAKASPPSTTPIRQPDCLES